MNQEYRGHFPAKLGHRKIPKSEKSVRTYIRTYMEHFCDQKSALLLWLTSCCEKEWKNDVVFKKVCIIEAGK